MENIKSAKLIKRLVSAIIDYSLIFGFIYIMKVFYGEENPIGGTSLSGFSALIVVLFWFVVTILFDYLFGHTIGNYVCNIKPVSIADINRKLTFGESIKRHFLDWIDLSFIGLILIIATERNQRLGDLCAKTIVINYKFK
jgi:uncharacterized RDD family membrane protein YckC